MRRNEEHAPPVNANVQFEPHRLHLRALAYVGLTVLATAVVLHAGMWWLLRQYVVSLPPPVIALPPPPRLQLDPALELRAKRARVEARLDSYGWVEQSASVIHIPIEEAMKQLVTRGLPGPDSVPKPTEPSAAPRTETREKER
jgi:hypothetical protein